MRWILVVLLPCALACAASDDPSDSDVEVDPSTPVHWDCDCWTTEQEAKFEAGVVSSVKDVTTRSTEDSGFCSATDPIEAEVKLLCLGADPSEPKKCGCDSCKRVAKPCTAKSAPFGDPAEAQAQQDASTPTEQQWSCGCRERGMIAGNWLDWYDTKTVPDGGFGACSADAPRSDIEAQCEKRLDAGILECKCTCAAKGPCE